MEVLIWLMIGCMFGVASMAIADEGNKGLAFVMGLMFGPIGLLVAAITKGKG
jgi:uncharacterized membrane protein YeaQ/YmgE (transglycosylase-associated protein family)